MNCIMVNALEPKPCKVMKMNRNLPEDPNDGSDKGEYDGKKRKWQTDQKP